MRRPALNGFTLTEVLVAVAIVGILAAMGLPQYRKAVERDYRRQAQDILTTIYYGERAYRLANSKFIAIPPAAWTDIYVDDPHVGALPPILFTVNAAAANTFTATATRRAGSGVCASKVIQIDENRTLTGDWILPAPGCP